jgi:enterochelin esterase-like enzyme
MKPPELVPIGRFRKAELSAPQYEHDHVRVLTVISPALQGRGDISLFVPPGSDALAEVPIVVLLHGAYGSHWDWFFKGGAHLTAQRLIAERKLRPMLIACPSDGMRGDATGYIGQRGGNFEAWIADDVIDIVRELFPFTGRKGPAFIAGLSMGGYGALRIGAKYPNKFRAISGHSSATGPGPLPRLTGDPSSYAHLPAEDLEIVHWARANKASLPPLRFDCGTEDFLYEDNRALHQRFVADGVAHDFVEFAGAHDWPYWREHIADSLVFFERVLGGKPR